MTQTPVEEYRRLNKLEASRITKAVFEHYISETPAPSKVLVYKQSLCALPGNYYQAAVRIETDYIKDSPKFHKVGIQFKLNKQNKVDSTSIKYT